MKRIPIFVALLAAAPLAAGPQAAPPQSSPVREEVLVTAERGPEPRTDTPASVSVLTREEIERLPAQNLAELLNFLPGFHVHGDKGFGGGVAMVSSRGFFGGGEAEYVQLLIDGVPVADIESGVADWRRIRAADIERVEALRGPSSSLYGDTALAGVVQVFTRRGARAATPGGGASISGGSFGSASGDVILRGGLGPVQAGFSGSVFTTDGFRAHSSGRDTGLALSLDAPAAGGRFAFALSGSLRDREDPGALTREQLRSKREGSDPLFRFDREETERGRASLTYNRESSGGRVRALVYGTRRQTDSLRTLLIAAGLGDRIFREIATNSFGGSFEGERSWGLSGLEPTRAGVDLAIERLDTDYRAVSDDGAAGDRVARASGERERIALFLSQGFRLSSRTRLSTGLRWDRIADDFGSSFGGARVDEAWSPRAGLNVRLGRLDGAPVSLFFQASRAFKAATLDQLFDPRPFPDFSGGSFTISNPDLSPQKAVNLEVGASQRVGATFWQASVYRMEVEDEIDFDAVTFSYRNIGKSLHVGVEVAARFFEGGPVSPSVAYAWSRVEPREGESRGHQLKNIPEHVLRPGLSAELPFGLRADIQYTWMAGRYLDDANELPLEDASVLDLRLARAFGAIEARLDLLNLADDEFSELGFALSDFTGGTVPYYLPAPGFAARVGLDWKF